MGINTSQDLVTNNKREEIIKVDKRYFRPLEVDYLKGDNRKALKILKFKPKYNFKTLISDMIKEDIKLAEEEYTLKNLR